MPYGACVWVPTVGGNPFSRWPLTATTGARRGRRVGVRGACAYGVGDQISLGLPLKPTVTVGPYHRPDCLVTSSARTTQRHCDMQYENQRQEPDLEQVVGEARPLFGDPFSPSGPVGSELESAELGEHGAVDEKGEDIRQRLKLLEDYFEEGLITEDDYATRKAAILGDL